MLKLLVVDDEIEITTLLKIFFERKGYTVRMANDGKAAVEAVEEFRPDLVFLDVRMPVMDGLTTLENIRLRDPAVKVIMVSALEHDDVVRQAMALGAVDYVCKPFNLGYLERDVINKVNQQLFVELRQEIDEKKSLINKLAHEAERGKNLNEKLKTHFFQTVLTLAGALEARDSYTNGHSERVDEYCRTIACELRDSRAFEIDDDFLAALHIEARLHDIGMIAVPDTVLNMAGPLTVHEFEYIKRHPREGSRILAPLEGFEEHRGVISSHHERPDGTGYPERKKQDEIPLRARIISVADAFDAMTSQRPYRKAMSPEQAIAELERNRGSQFDPQVVDAFIRAYRRHGGIGGMRERVYAENSGC